MADRPVVRQRSLETVLGENVRDMREEREMTQRDLAERLRELGWQLDTTALTRIESGTRSVRLSQLQILAEALGTSPMNLVQDDVDALTDFRMQVERLVGARRALVQGLEAASQVVGRARGAGGREKLEATGLRGVDPSEYFEHVRQRAEQYAKSEKAERVHVFNGDGEREAMVAIVSALLADLFEEWVDTGDGSYVPAEVERKPLPDIPAQWMLG